jgi:hypothetical protein
MTHQHQWQWNNQPICTIERFSGSKAIGANQGQEVSESENVLNIQPEDVMTSLVGDLIQDNPKAAPLVFDQDLEEEEGLDEDENSETNPSLQKLESNNFETAKAQTTTSPIPTSTVTTKASTTTTTISTTKDTTTSTADTSTTITSTTTTATKASTTTTTSTTTTISTTTNLEPTTTTTIRIPTSTTTTIKVTKSTTNNSTGETELVESPVENVHLVESPSKSLEINSLRADKVEYRFESEERKFISDKNLKSSSASTPLSTSIVTEDAKYVEPTSNNDEIDSTFNNNEIDSTFNNDERDSSINFSSKIDERAEVFDALIRVQSGKVQENVSSNIKDDFHQDASTKGNTLISVDDNNLEEEKTFQNAIEKEVTNTNVNEVFQTPFKLDGEKETKEAEAKTEGQTERESFNKVETDSNVLTAARSQGERETRLESVKQKELENAERQTTDNDLKFNVPIFTHFHADNESNENEEERKTVKNESNEREEERKTVKNESNESEQERKTVKNESNESEGERKTLKNESEEKDLKPENDAKNFAESENKDENGEDFEEERHTQTDSHKTQTGLETEGKTDGKTDSEETTSLRDLKPERSKAFSGDEKLTKKNEKIPKIFQRIEVEDVKFKASGEFKADFSQVTIQSNVATL